MSNVRKGIIFDLDGTLYDTDLLDLANKSAIRQALAEWKGTSLDSADRELTTEVERRTGEGGRSSLYKAALALGLPDTLIEKWQMRELNPERDLKADPRMAGLLEQISQFSLMALLTNTRTEIAIRAVAALGIEASLFRTIRGGDLLFEAKPSPEDLKAIIDMFELEPWECLSVGDRWDVDLEPARSLGMSVILVSGRDELCEMMATWIHEDAGRKTAD